MISKKRGRFSVSMEYFANNHENANIFKDMLILEAQHNHATDQINYLAIHPSFKECIEGLEAPIYMPTFKGGAIYPEWILND